MVLPLPTDAFHPGKQLGVKAVFPNFTKKQVQVSNATGRRQTATIYQDSDVIAKSHAIEPRPREGALKLRVDIRMAVPDSFGGMFQAYCIVTVGNSP